MPVKKLQILKKNAKFWVAELKCLKVKIIILQMLHFGLKGVLQMIYQFYKPQSWAKSVEKSKNSAEFNLRIFLERTKT